MQASFRRFMSDHEEIESAAATLLIDVQTQSSGADVLFRQLKVLAEMVDAHILVEDEVVKSLDLQSLNGPWEAVWAEGKSSFERLRSDRTAFLARWSMEKIVQERSRFSFECRAILGRISERLRQETQSFYAAALQFGSISLR